LKQSTDVGTLLSWPMSCYIRCWTWTSASTFRRIFWPT